MNGSDPDRLDYNSLAAAERLTRSPRVRWLVLTLGAVIWSAFVGSSGWIIARLDLRNEISALKKELQLQSGEIAILTGRQNGVLKKLDELEEPPAGKLPIINAQIRFTRRDLVAVTAALFAFEPTDRKAKKQAVGEKFAAAYDRQISQGSNPAQAADAVLGKVAVP